MIEMKRIGRSTSCRGTSTVEMAMILPVLLLLALGAVDLGRMFYDAVGVANAARAGLSYGSLSEAYSQDTTKITEVANADAVSLQGGVTLNVTRICHCVEGNQHTQVDCESGPCSGGWDPWVYLKVQASKTYSTMLPFPGVPDSVSITRDAYMQVD